MCDSCRQEMFNENVADAINKLIVGEKELGKGVMALGFAGLGMIVLHLFHNHDIKILAKEIKELKNVKGE